VDAGLECEHAFSVKVLHEYGRNQDSNITRLSGIDQMPVFASRTWLMPSPRWQPRVRVRRRRAPPRQRAARRRRSRARRRDRQTTLVWLWNTNVRATPWCSNGFARRGDDPVFVQRMVRWLLQARTNGRWRQTPRKTRRRSKRW
jgi:hypothetical protein